METVCMEMCLSTLQKSPTTTQTTMICSINVTMLINLDFETFAFEMLAGGRLKGKI